MTAYDDALDLDSPVSHWKLGDTATATAVDRKAVQNGVYNNSPTLDVAGLLPANAANNASDNCVTFNGSNQSVTIADNTLYRPTSFSIEFWIKIPASAPADFKGVFFKTSGDSWNDGYGVSWRNQSSVFSLEWWCNNFANAVVIPVSLNETLYVAGTFSGGTIRAYKNGAEVGTPVTGITVTHSTNQMYLSAGASVGGFVNYWMASTLDEVALYGSALSAGSILNHYNSGAGIVVVPPPTLYVSRAPTRLG